MKDSYAFYTDQLDGEYKETFTQIEMYVAAAGVDEPAREEQLGQLLDVFLTAQQAGKPVKKIVGNDLEEFCIAFCTQFGWKNKLYDLMDRIKSLAVGLLVLCVLDVLSLGIRMLEGETVHFWQETSEFPLTGFSLGALMGVVVGGITNFLVRRLMFRSKRVSMTVLKAVTYTVTAATCVLAFVLVMLDQNGPAFPIWILTLCAASYLVFYYTANHKRLRAQKREKVRFTDMVSQELETGIGDAMEEKFQQINARRVKRGKQPLPMEQFLDKQEKNDRIGRKTECMYILLPLVITGLALLLGSFDSMIDMIVYAIVMLAVELTIMLWFWKMERKARVHRAAWIQKKREEQAQN